jgi:wyosine [tRNA(Phe)-imidazoG37] synthetase (radical SAM superfamily)
VLYECLFGPIISRRLGISLGINLIPKKTCNLNCIYCEVGATQKFVEERAVFYPTELVIKELENFFTSYRGQKIDAFTFSGAGEPTLALNLGEVIRFLKTHHAHAHVAVITNSTLLDKEDVINDLLLADRIMPSLDAATQELFQKIDRGKSFLQVEKIIEGLVHLRKYFKGEIDLEIFLTDEKQFEKEQIEAYKKAIKKIKPDRIDINVLDRPGTSKDLVAMSKEKVTQFQELLGGPSLFSHNTKKVDLENKMKKKDKQALSKKREGEFQKEILKQENKKNLFHLLEIRAVSFNDALLSLNAKESLVKEFLQELIQEGKIKKEKQGEKTFYSLIQKKE